MNLTTRCPHCGNPRQRHHHESPWCDECFRSLFERLDRLEAIAAAHGSPSHAPVAPARLEGGKLGRRFPAYAGMASCDGQPVDDCGCGAMPMTAPDHACNAWEARTDG